MPDRPVQQSQWDRRPDGTQKGNGFLGALLRPDGGVMSEYSVADSERLKDAHGNYLDYPTLVPTLTPHELKFLLTAREGDRIPDSIYEKAEAHALQRVSRGLPVFAQPGEEVESLYPEFKRLPVQMLNGDIHLPNNTGVRDPRLPSSITEHAKMYGPKR